MEPNNAEVIETNSTESDTTGTPDLVAVEAGQAVEGEVTTESSVESNTAQIDNSDLVYDFEGEEVSAATIKSWKDDGLRQADYTKKSQANADARKQLESKGLELTERMTSLDSKIAALDEAIESGKESVDWDYLRENDISEYTKQKELLVDKEAKASTAKAEIAEMKAAEDTQRLGIEQQLLLDKMPQWSDPVKGQANREADVKLVEAYIKDSGFSDESFNKLTDHNLMLMAINAAKFSELQNKTAETEKLVAKAPNVVKATKKTQPKTTTRAERFYGKK